MTRKAIALVLLVSVLNLMSGCVYKTENVLLENRSSRPEGTISGVVLVTGESVEFDYDGGFFDVRDSTLSGRDTQGKAREFKYADVLYLRVKTVNEGLTALVWVLTPILTVAAMVGLLALSCCPLIYSYDGARYVFDAEPLGGAISRGLAKTDYSRLDYVRDVGGNYELRVRNEMPETQMLDEMQIVVVEHPVGTRIFPDLNGVMHAVTNPLTPVSARDERGGDIRASVLRTDNVVWQSELPIDSSYKNKETRHHLTFTFPLPRGTRTTYLLVNAGTATWGAAMIRNMMELRGDKVEQWYENVDARGLELLKLWTFISREELFVLKAQVREGDGWVERALIAASGPLAAEDRLYALDFSNVVGDSLTIRFNPPIGYWAIDYVAVNHEVPAKATVQHVGLGEAVDQDGRDVTAPLSSSDGVYHSMPRTGDFFTARFPAMPQRSGMQRSVFLQTTGYYRLHLPKDTQAKSELVEALINTPGLIGTYSLDEYMAWRAKYAIVRK